MIKKTNGKTAQCFVKFKTRSVVILCCLSGIIAGVSCIAIQNSYAFWTYNKPGDHPQHMRITQLVRYPQNQMFSKYWRNMGKWSEEPDAGKDSLFGHGNEEFRGKQSLDAALDHYRKYLKNPERSGEVEIAAQCLAHAYHYFEDVGDFSEGKIPLRKSVSAELNYLHKNYDWTRTQIDAKKRDIQPNRNEIIGVLKQLKRQKISNQNSDQIRDALLLIVASLEQMNVFFLEAVNQQRQPQPSPPQVSPIQRAWQGSWTLVSKHTGGKFKGSSVSSYLTVSFNQNNQVKVTFGKYTASVKSITQQTLVYEVTSGGNKITTTLHRVGRGIKGNFQGIHVASGEAVMGEFRSDPPP